MLIERYSALVPMFESMVSFNTLEHLCDNDVVEWRRNGFLLFDLQAGEKFRATDLVDDDANDPGTRQYIEAVAYTGRGDAELALRPGRYRIVTSRGPEYDLRETEITVGPAETRSITHALNRVVDTAGWIAGVRAGGRPGGQWTAGGQEGEGEQEGAGHGAPDRVSYLA